MPSRAAVRSTRPICSRHWHSSAASPAASSARARLSQSPWFRSSCSRPCSVISVSPGANGSRERAMTEALVGSAKSSNVASSTPDTMEWDSRARRVVMIYLPLGCFVLILLVPFYWMAITSFKPNGELLNYKAHNPFWISSPTLMHIRHLLFTPAYPHWLMTTMSVAVGATFISILSSTLAAYAIERLRFRGSPYVGLAIYLAYLVPPSILFIPLATVVVQFGLFDSPLALILVYSTFLVPFCPWLLIGYFKSIPYELEECALVDGATRLQILRRITLPLAVPGLISAGIFSFTLSWN